MAHHRHVSQVPAGIDAAVRLTGNERIQHAIMFIAFTLLAISGFMTHLPRAWVRVLGLASPAVFEFRGDLHRVCGIALCVVGIYHVAYLLGTRRGRWQLRELLPRKRDWLDFVATMRYYRRPSEHPQPEYGWYNYAEKAEYWALVWGTFIMAVTGFILWLEEYSPKIVIDVSAVVHRYEALLAVLAVLVWHFYHVHLSPEVFPMSPVWLTGREASGTHEHASKG